MKIECEISLGELVDKISILRIKLRHIKEKTKLEHVLKEEGLLYEKLASMNLEGIDHHLNQMVEVNQNLWTIEDDIRELERQKKFNQDFIDLARAVYITNDERFRRKNIINNHYQSNIVEVKSYKEY